MAYASASNIEWRVYGHLDFGVSHDLDHGIAEWRELKGVLCQYGITRFGTCVEVGCGAGRLTNALAQDFQATWALDVSPERILQVSRVPNAARIHPILVDKPVIPLQDNTVDLCTSTHVFQHISDMTIVNAYLQEMFRVLAPGGCILIHVPVVGAHGFSGRLSQIVRRRAKELAKDLALPLFRVLIAAGISSLPKIGKIGLAKYRVFEYGEIYRCLKDLGFSPIEMRFLARAGIHSYIFARKPL